MSKLTIVAGLIIVFAAIAFLLYGVRPASKLYKITVENSSGKKRLLTVLVVVFTVLCSVLPMKLSPVWNGEIPGHRNQYELMAEAILDGHLYLDKSVDPRLEEMDNPYDPDARKALGVKAEWDHAYYDGHYYMYFGVVPVFLVFLPFRILTGASLTTYCATQIFVAGFILGVFMLFSKLAKRFFKELPLSMYLFLSVAVSTMSVWYIVGAPALYCTAIASAICMEIWSLYFFIKAVYDKNTERRTYLYAFLGSLFGALAFGCRPSIALANILVIPLLITFLKDRKFSLKMLGKLLLSALPYVVIGVLLMLYNYVRFENPFEFGQAYQLTVADQTAYGSIFSTWDTTKIIQSLHSLMLGYSEKPIRCGVLLVFPVLIYSVIGLANSDARRIIKESKISSFVYALFVSVLLIIVIDVLWSPYIIPRYSMDFTWLMGIAAYLIIGFYYKVKPDKERFSCFICLLSLYAILMSVNLFLYPSDYNYTHYYNITMGTLWN